MLHYEKELNAISRLFLDFYIKTANLRALSEFTREVRGTYDLEFMNTIQHCTASIAEKNLARLLMEVHKTDKHDLFGCLKINKHEVLTILRKHKHKNTIVN